ncbi:S-layer homology domain-containing protein [Paenibacillus sp. P46E]|uniref:NHL domain-containing protein n=1 Tax=Paenibacillus sp. P46E TaxID=1349436 RepID=UPI00093A793D|nr:S-layer homology domain-containing protein [Paenibacillus sp. P46E]OKQ00036.1 hypothetical protein A3849_02280 [Paenibacillus sp. P46E]
MYKKAKQFVAAVLAVLLITGLLPEWSGGKAYAASGYTITSIAGTGVAGFSGDGGQATLAQLGGLPPWLTLPSDGKEDLSGGMAVDSNGNMYIADIVNNRIRKIDTSGKITTVAGTGVAGFSGDGQAATLAQLSGPRGVAVDSSGNLYIADGENSRIRKVDTSGKISTVAGGGTSVGLMDGKAATLGQLRGPRGVAVDSDGNLYIAEYYNNVIRKVDTSGTISTVAGTMGKNGVGTQGFLGDGFAATLAQLYHPSEVGLDNNGNLYILDSGNRRIRKVDVNGLISTVAGGGLGTAAKLDGATATGVPLPDSKGMAIDSNGNMYVTDYYTERVFKIDQVTRVISVLAGIDGGVLTSTQLSFPTAVTVDSKGNLYMADGSYSRIRKLTAPAVDPGDGGGGTVPESKCCISTVAGNGNGGYSGDGGLGSKAQLNWPFGVAVDSKGNLYIADSDNQRIRKVDTSGMISTMAGTGKRGPTLANDGLATKTLLDTPYGVSVDNNDNVYIADKGNNRILKVDTFGIISVVAGIGGIGGYSGDGGLATAAKLNNPTGVAIDSSGNLFIADRDNQRIRKVDASGKISTFAGTGDKGNSGDGGLATAAQLSGPRGVAVDSSGNLYILSYGFVRKVDTSGKISTVAGSGSTNFTGDGGLATLAGIDQLSMGLAVDSSGNLYIADRDKGRIRKVDTSGKINTVVGGGYSGDGVGATLTSLNFPNAVALDSSGNLYIAESGHSVRKVRPAKPAQTVRASALMNKPGVGTDNTLYLVVMDEGGTKDTTFSGAHDVTISGYAAAPDGSYGSVNGNVLTASPTTISLTFANGLATANLKLNQAAAQTISSSVADVATPAANAVSITPAAGKAASLILSTDLAAPASSGGAFAQQPVVTLYDAYGNVSTGDSSTVVTVSKKDTGTWTLTGTATKTASAGVVAFTGLGAANAAEVTGAQLAFDAAGLPQLTSTTVTLPAPEPAQTVGAAVTTATPGVGMDDAITLTVKNSQGSADTTFNGAHDVTISGYAAAPDGSYGSVNGDVLTASPTTISLTFANGSATANLKLNQAAAQTISLSVADVATPAAKAVSITPVAGKAASLALSTDLAAPASNGGVFKQQPVVTLRDAYGNTSTGDSSTVVTISKKDTGTWTLTGTATKTASAGVVAFTGLGAANAAEVTGAQLAFDAAGLPQLTSTTLTLPAPEPAQTVSAAVTTVTPGVGMDDAITLTVKNSQGTTNTTFSGAYDVTVSGYAAAPDGSYGSVNGEALTASPNTISVTFASGVATVKLKLYQAAEQTISLSVTGVTTPAANPLSITPVAGKAASLALSTDLAAPASNGGVFKQQPVVTLRDAYGNTSTGDSSTVVTISKKDTGPWTLTGTATSTASAGVVAFAGLGAANAAEVTGAQLAFDAAGLPQLASTTVTLPAPMANAVAPHVNSAAGGDSHVLLNWNEAYGSVSYAVYQRTASDPYGAAVATVSGSVYSYDVKGLTNGTTYYFVVKATNSVGDSATSDEISGTPRTVPSVPSVPMDVTAVAGEGQATVSFTIPAGDGGSAITGYEVTASPGNLTATGTTSPITITGLSNGLTYTFTVKAINNVGSSAASTASNTVTPKAPNDSTPAQPGTPSTPVQPGTPSAPDTSLTGVEFLVNGKAEKAGLATTTQVNEQTVTTVVLDPKVLEDKLAAVGQDAVITISVKTKSDIVIGEMNGQMLKDMEPKHAVIVIKTENATYTLPAQQVDISALSEQFGKNIQFKDIKVQIEISKPAADIMKIVENAAAKGRFTPVTPPLNFTVRGTYGDTTIEVSKFNAYVERTMVLPEGTDPSKITTGVVIDPDGTVRPIPTQIVIIDGKYVAKVNSLTNSTYSIVEYPIEFKDISQHWAKNAVNDMGFRRVVNGTGKGMFNPDQAITRAEFATIMVRGLGLKPENGSSPFADVKNTDWYSGAIQTAYAYKLISGFEDGTFRPNDQITREQAMVVIAKAMKITTLKSKLPVEPTDAILRPYTDAADASRWALSSMADSIQAGVVSGRTSTEFAPKAYLTRAEVTTIIQRLLQKSGLID